MPADKLENLLKTSPDRGLADVVERAREMGALTETLSKALDPEMGQALVAANIRDDGELVVIARSPAWAARLRFEADKLLAAAQAAGEDVSSCSVRVSHDT